MLFAPLLRCVGRFAFVRTLPVAGRILRGRLAALAAQPPRMPRQTAFQHGQALDQRLHAVQHGVGQVHLIQVHLAGGLGMLLCQGAEAFRLYSKGLEMPIDEIQALLYD